MTRKATFSALSTAIYSPSTPVVCMLAGLLTCAERFADPARQSYVIIRSRATRSRSETMHTYGDRMYRTNNGRGLCHKIMFRCVFGGEEIRKQNVCVRECVFSICKIMFNIRCAGYEHRATKTNTTHTPPIPPIRIVFSIIHSPWPGRFAF